MAYQLWGTGIQTKQAQNRLSDQFADVLSTTTVPASTTTTVRGAVAAPPTTAAPSTPAARTTTAPSAPPTTTPQAGDPVARLEIPKIGLDYITVQGVGVDQLKQGPGHYPDTPLPGHNGNVAIAGHRTTYGHPFYRINELAAGDDVILTTPTGHYVYKVTEQFIVAPTQSEVLAPTTDAQLTPDLVPSALLGPPADHREGEARRHAVVAARDEHAARRDDDHRRALPAPTAPVRRRGSTTTTTVPTTVRVPATIPGDAAVAAGDLQRGWFGDTERVGCR